MWERDSEGSDVTVGEGFLYGWQLNLEPNYFIVCFEVASIVLVFLLVVVTLVGGSCMMVLVVMMAVVMVAVVIWSKL